VATKSRNSRSCYGLIDLSRPLTRCHASGLYDTDPSRHDAFPGAVDAIPALI